MILLLFVTFDTAVRRFQIGHEVALTRMQINQVPDVHLAALSRGALAVEIPQNVRRTADVEIAIDAATNSHSAVHRRPH